MKNRVQKRICLGFGVVLSLVAAACGGGDSGQKNGAGDAAGSANTCGLSMFDFSKYDPFTTSGSATLLFQGTTLQFKELTCQTLRNVQGQAIGYAAVFANKTPEPDMEAIVELDKDNGGFLGDTTYRKVYVEMLERSPSSLNEERTYTEVTLTLSQGGKHGVAENADGTYRLEYTCDPKDDTSNSANPPLGELKPGSAELVRTDGLVMRFYGLVCTSNGGFSSDVSVSAPEQGAVSRDAYSLNFDVPSPNEQDRSTNLWGTYFDIVHIDSESVDVDFDCSTGILRPKTGYSSNYTGRFLCPRD